jgi:hypothetical protein
LVNTKRLGRYHNYNHPTKNNNDDPVHTHSSDIAQLYKDINRKPPLDWNKTNISLVGQTTIKALLALYHQV